MKYNTLIKKLSYAAMAAPLGMVMYAQAASTDGSVALQETTGVSAHLQGLQTDVKFPDNDEVNVQASTNDNQPADVTVNGQSFDLQPNSSFQTTVGESDVTVESTNESNTMTSDDGSVNVQVHQSDSGNTNRSSRSRIRIRSGADIETSNNESIKIKVDD